LRVAARIRRLATGAAILCAPNDGLAVFARRYVPKLGEIEEVYAHDLAGKELRLP
jgi:hypothetical protein